MIFRNNVKGTHTQDVTAEVQLIPEDFSVVIPKQPVLGGVAGNPWIWVQLLDDQNSPMADPFFLGRCSTL